MYTVLAPEDIKRKAAFELFREYDDPFFNISTELDLGTMIAFSKARGYSFNLCLLFASMHACNRIEEFRLRYINEEIRLYDEIHCGSTVSMEDDTFSFAYFGYTRSIDDFVSAGTKAIEDTRSRKKLEPRTDMIDLVHHSMLPWIRFTSVKHARRIPVGDSIPKITFGRFSEQGNGWRIPVSVEVHHALMDGLQVARYLEQLEAFFKNPESITS